MLNKIVILVSFFQKEKQMEVAYVSEESVFRGLECRNLPSIFDGGYLEEKYLWVRHHYVNFKVDQ